jgi:hypothetical protein
MTLQQVMGNYGSVERSNMYSAGSALNVQEYTRKGEVVGFTAADINLDVSIWDLTKEDGLPVLRIVYRDQRERREIDRMHPMRR